MRRHFVSLGGVLLHMCLVQSLCWMDDSWIAFILLARPRLPLMDTLDVVVALWLGVKALGAIILTARELLLSIQLLEALTEVVLQALS
jgi:hypothetical protein